MAQDNAKPIYVNPANTAIPVIGATTHNNVFLSFFKNVGQFVRNHERWARIKAGQVIDVIKDVETNSTEFEAATKDILSKGAILAHTVSKGTANGQNILSNPDAFRALENFVATFESYHGLLESIVVAYEGREIPSKPVETSAPVVTEPIPATVPVITESVITKPEPVIIPGSFVQRKIKLTTEPTPDTSTNATVSIDQTITGLQESSNVSNAGNLLQQN